MSIVADIYSIPVEDGPFAKYDYHMHGQTLANSIFMYPC